MNHTLRSRQLNPCDHLFWKSRGYPERPHNWKQILEDSGYYDGSDDENCPQEEYDPSDHETDECYTDDETDSEYEENRLRSLQNNPNNDEYWRLRGFPGRPDDWHERVYGTSSNQSLLSENSTEEEYDSESEYETDDNEDYTDDESDGEYDEEHRVRSLQNNPNNDEYWRLRGFPRRPNDWHERVYGTSSSQPVNDKANKKK